MSNLNVDHEERAGRLWPVLVVLAKNEMTTTYSDAARSIGIHHRPLRYVLEPIQDYCIKEGLPRLTALVISKSTGLQGAGFLGRPGNDADLDEVFAFDWSSVDNPFSDLNIAELEGIAEELAVDPTAASEKYAKILSRGNRQRVFRRAVLNAYDWKCCICGLTFPEGLETAHIVRWASAQPHLRIDPRNGLSLCSTHHKLYDNGRINVTPEYVVNFSDPDELEGRYSEADRYHSVRLHGSSIQLPKQRALWPDPQLLTVRQDDWK